MKLGLESTKWMSKKKKESLKGKEVILSQKKLIALSAALSLTIALIFIIFALQSTDIPFSMNAAIIDQLGESDPSSVNYTFVENAKNLLLSHNFTVTYYNESLNIDFFRNLAKLNSGIIILRVHSALRKDNSTVDLFTSEEFIGGYDGERQNDLVVIGQYLYTSANETKYFCAITHKFIEELEGRFPKSIIIAMGCWSLKPECQQLAAAFIKKGAKAYIGWTNVVLSKDTDQDTITFLERLLNNENLADATKSLKHTYYDPMLQQNVYTNMTFYPTDMWNLKISDLLTEVKSSNASLVFNPNIFSVFMTKVEFLRAKILKLAC